MKKKSFIVLLSVTLVLVLASAGVCFGYSLDTAIPFTPIQNIPIFTSIPLDTCFAVFDFSSVNINSLVGDGVKYPLWNNIEFTVLTSQPIENGQHTQYGVALYYNNNGSYIAARTVYLTDVYDNPMKMYFRSGSSDLSYIGVSGGGSIWNSMNNISNLSPTPSVGELSYTDVGAVTDRFHFSLPYGNALLISSSSDFVINRRSYNISNTTYNYQKYVRASDNFSYRVNGSYQGVVENSNIVGNFGVNVFGSNDVMSLLIPWQPVNQNVLGRATEYNYYNASLNPSDEITLLSGQSFMIWYPYYANNQDTSKINETNMDVSIDINHSSPITFTTFPITGSSATSGEDSYIQNTASTSSGGSSSQSDGGDGSINVTFDNAPTAGGNHGQAPINDNNSILGVLSNLQNTLLGLFNKAIDGIHNLITLGSDFLQSVQIMFSWLPAELLVIITSGFVILLTIGVLKTLWR